METIYKTVKVKDSILYINKQEILKLDISHEVFKDNLISSLKDQLIKYPSDKKRLNYLLDNGFKVDVLPNGVDVYNNKVRVYISTFKNSVTVIYS